MSDTNESYAVINVPPDASGTTEAMGTKFKFWFRDDKGAQCLFKQARENTGEDWAEKVACELCGLLDIPHAQYDLAISGGQRGTVSPSFIPENATLVHGNELLLDIDASYAPAKAGRQRYYRVSQHTVEIVLSVLGGGRTTGALVIETPWNWTRIKGIHDAVGVFLGYLMLDAWIGNQDRHHENWAILVGPTPDEQPVESLYLAPTYDHASSLGRNESDETREKRLLTRDAGYSLETYARKAKSAFYARQGDTSPLTTLDAFRMAAEKDRNAAKAWLHRLGGISDETVSQLLHRIPSERISTVGIEFTRKLLEINQQRLLALLGDWK